MIKWDKAYMINLDSEKDKWSSFSEFKEFERFSALDSREKPFMYRDYGFELAPTDELFKYTSEYFSQSKGAVGCYFSHYEIWKKIIKEKYDWCLVLEDDVCPKSLRRFFDIEAYKDLYYWTFDDKGIEQKDIDFMCLNTRSFNTTSMKGTEAYLISQKAAKILIKETNNTITCPVDNYIGKIGARDKKFKFYKLPLVKRNTEAAAWSNSSVTQGTPFWVIDNMTEEEGAEWVRQQDFYKWWEKCDD